MNAIVLFFFLRGGGVAAADDDGGGEWIRWLLDLNRRVQPHVGLIVLLIN